MWVHKLKQAKAKDEGETEVAPRSFKCLNMSSISVTINLQIKHGSFSSSRYNKAS